MSFWEKLLNAVAETATNALSGLVEAIRTIFEGDPETRRQVAFSVAVIALSAKMAKADGIVTQDEVRAFQQIFSVPTEQVRNVARLYDLAKEDIAGFEAYAAKMASLFNEDSDRAEVLEDILDGLFHIAKADGFVHEREVGFLRRTAEIFAFGERDFDRILARHTLATGANPYQVLGVSTSASLDEVRRRYRTLVLQNHPDRLIARGMPEEFIAIATRRLAAINVAFEAIEQTLARV